MKDLALGELELVEGGGGVLSKIAAAVDGVLGAIEAINADMHNGGTSGSDVEVILGTIGMMARIGWANG